MLSLELFISWRYLITKRKEKFISLISIISILGVAIGVAALIVVIAVMSGFDRDLREKIVGNYAHITISTYQGISEDEYAGIVTKISLNPHVKKSSPYLQGQMLFKEGERFLAVGVKGIEPQREIEVTKIKNYLIQGSLDNLTEPDTVIIGKELALHLGLGMGSYITTYSPLGKRHNLKVGGIFYSGMYDYDLNLTFVHLKTAQEILGLNGRITAISVKLDNLYLAEKIKRELASVLNFEYNLKTWMEANANFFAALKLEKLTMFIILVLITLVASFNIISTLVVMVVEKTKDIGILKAVGMTGQNIRRIFAYEGMLIGIAGILLGTLTGVLICILLEKYQFIKLPQDIYYIDRLPVALKIWPDILLIILAALTITLLSTIYPSLKAFRLKPVEALRYE